MPQELRESALSAMMSAVVIGALLVVAAPTAGAIRPLPSARVATDRATSDWLTVSAGALHTCGIRTNGRLYCWGADSHGQLGNGGANATRDTPTEVAGGHANWVAVSAGAAFTCGLRSTGRLYCWGSDNYGKLGNGGTNTDRPTPTEVAGGVTSWTAFATGYHHTCARRSTGRLYCWGSDFEGELGDGGNNASRSTPTEVTGGHVNWGVVSAGFGTTCARRTTGRLYCWGADNHGQVGDGGANTNRNSPTEVAGGHSDWTHVGAGYVHVCARRSTGRLYCWGRDNRGQLGDGGANASRTVPTQVAGGATSWTGVDGGGSHTCGWRSTGRLYCWGNDVDGALGDGLPKSDRTTPAEVFGGRTDWRPASAGQGHTCARDAGKGLYCWGADGFQQLGNGPSSGDQPEPAVI